MRAKPEQGRNDPIATLPEWATKMAEVDRECPPKNAITSAQYSVASGVSQKTAMTRLNDMVAQGKLVRRKFGQKMYYWPK
jgi:Fic family protein